MSFTHRAKIESGSFPRARPAGAKRTTTLRDEYDFCQGKRGAVLSSPGKTRITIMLDDFVIQYFRAASEAQGTGYQTMINSALRAMVNHARNAGKDEEPLTVAKLREVLREE